MQSTASPAFKLTALAIAVSCEIGLTSAWLLLCAWVGVQFAPLSWWQIVLLAVSIFTWAKSMELATYRMFLRLIGAKS